MQPILLLTSFQSATPLRPVSKYRQKHHKGKKQNEKKKKNSNNANQVSHKNKFNTCYLPWKRTFNFPLMVILALRSAKNIHLYETIMTPSICTVHDRLWDSVKCLKRFFHLIETEKLATRLALCANRSYLLQMFAEDKYFSPNNPNLWNMNIFSG